MKDNNKLPKGWEVKKLGEILDFKNGINFTKEQRGDTVGILTLDVKNMYSKGLEVTTDRLYRVNKTIKEEYLLKNNDILFVRSSVKKEGVGWPCYFEEQSEPISFCGFIIRGRPKLEFNPEFLTYILRCGTLRRNLIARSSQATITNINQNSLSKINVPLPPLLEQKRITQKLDNLFQRIDKAVSLVKTNIEAIPTLKASILDKAFKGQLFGGVAIGKNGLPEGWAINQLTSVVDFIGGSQPPKSVFSQDQKKDYVRLIQIRDYKSNKYVVYIPKERTKKFCKVNDVMIGRYGPPVFQILRGLEGAYNVALMKATPKTDEIDNNYLFWFLKNPSIQNYIIGISQRAAGQSGVNKKALEAYEINLPPLPAQKRITKKIDNLFQRLDQTKTEYQQKLNSLEALRSSILDQAFKGKL